MATAATAEGVDPHDALASLCATPSLARLTNVYEPGRVRLAVVPTATEERVVETCRRVFPHAVYADVRLAVERACAEVAVMVKSTRLQPFVTVRSPLPPVS